MAVVGQSLDMYMDTTSDCVDEYSLFARGLRSGKDPRSDILDPESGTIAIWINTCSAKLDDYRSGLSTDQRRWWSLERNTWKLLQMIYSDRLAPEPDTSKGEDHPYLPPINVVNDYLSRSRAHTELATLLDWARTCTSAIHPAEVRRGYHPHTKHALRHALQSQGSTKQEYIKNGSTLHLDPDAPLRSSGSGLGGRLVSDDQAYEKASLRTMFEYVRAGDVEAAADFARQTGHPWRAASISGGIPMSDPVIAPLPSTRGMGGDDGDDDDDDGMMEDDYEDLDRSGCLRRSLWKKTCRRLADCKALDQYERALYGAISGDVASVLPVCESWEDHIWCYVNALFEEEIDRILWQAADGSFWTRGVESERRQIDDTASGHTTALTSELSAPSQSVDVGLKKAFERVLRSDRSGVAESARDPFHVTQMSIATGQAAELLTDIVQRLPQLDTMEESDQLAHLLRFFAHLTLVLRQLQQPVDDEQANKVIRSYVEQLKQEGKDEFIAFYAAELRSEMAVDTYANYLVSLGVATNYETRKSALLRAREHGVDLTAVAQTAVDMTLEEVSTAHHGVTSQDNRMGLDEQKKIVRSLEWLMIDRSTYRFCLTRANEFIRLFLLERNSNAARDAFKSLPVDLIVGLKSVQEEDEVIENEIMEHEAFNLLFECFRIHEDVTSTLAEQPIEGSSKSSHRVFGDQLKTLIDDLHTKVLTILEMSWLQRTDDEVESGIDARLESDRASIRKQYIPELVFRLHFSLVDSGRWIPSNLQRALDVANVLADERYKLYVEFIDDDGGRDKLVEYLHRVRQVTLDVLAVSRTAPLRVLPGAAATRRLAV